jgi:LacI family transcriptional regulator
MTGGNRPRRRRESTIRDVADLAGVSIGTVSNVLNRPEKVAVATRDRVRGAIERAGFIPNGNARSLATGTANSVAMIVPDITNSLFVDMTRGAQEAARELGLSLIIANSDVDLAQQDGYLDFFAEARISGILLAPMYDSRGGVQRVRDHGRPVVLLNYEDPHLDACTVLMDNKGGGKIAALHAFELGYRRLIFVAVEDIVQPVRERRLGLRAVVEDTGMALEEITIEDLRMPGEGQRIGRLIAERWTRDDEPIAVLAVTDILAEGIIEGILSNPDIRIPEDIAVMGMDGNRMSWDSSVTMSTLDLPGFDMGAQALRLLMDERRPEHVHETIVLPMTLRARESTIGRRPHRA